MFEKDGYYVWQRGEEIHLSNNFTTREFECKCGECKEQRISVSLVEGLQWIREAAESTVRIHSGYRCEAYNTKIGGKGQHPLGNASDFSTSKQHPRELEKLAAHKFKAIGVGSNFIHVDTRDDKRRRWTYQ